MSDDKVQKLQVKRSSRLSGFYRETPERRRKRRVESRWLAPEDAQNVIGLPLGVALDFGVNGRGRLVSMAVEGVAR